MLGMAYQEEKGELQKSPIAIFVKFFSTNALCTFALVTDLELTAVVWTKIFAL